MTNCLRGIRNAWHLLVFGSFCSALLTP
ncbi:DUF3265 domain-containing protein [Vibrio cholerae]|nr:DUF3265 domain-containing protein [Vibrio cholerae]